MMQKFNKYLRSIMIEFKDSQLFYQRSLMILMIIFYLTGILFKRSFWLLSLLIILISGFFFYFTKEFIQVKKAKKQYQSFVITLIFGCCELVNGIIYHIPFGILLLLLSSNLAIASIIWVKLVPTRKEYEKIYKLEDFLGESAYKEAGGIAHGDTVLGIVKDTGKPNIVPYKDRFLHFLIIGPTGSGKTSQSLTPMVARDVHYEDIGIVALEPKGDFAEVVYALSKLAGRKDVVYFNPTLKGCPYFNPLRGELNDVIESVTTAFGSMDGDSKQYFKDMNSSLMRAGITVVKTLYGDDATLIQLNSLFTDYKKAKKMIAEFQKLPANSKEESDKRNEIANWFNNDYLTGMDGGRGGTKTFENSSGVRTQLTNLISNGYLRKVLNPPSTSTLKPEEYIDFERVLEEGSVLAMCSAQGALRDLGKILGMFLIQSFEAAVFRRPGDENTRKGVMFYVDEFQKYANKGYDDLLTQGRSYRVSSILATQSRSGIAINSGALGKVLTDLVSTNARNKVIYPGCSYEDARYYSLEFGDKEELQESITYNRSRGILSRFDYADQREAYKAEKKYVPLFTPSQIMKKRFGEATSSIVYKNSIQDARSIILEFIDIKLKKECDQYIEKYIRTRASKDYLDSLKWDVTEDEKVDTTLNELKRDPEYQFPEGFEEAKPKTSSGDEYYFDETNPIDSNIKGDYGNDFILDNSIQETSEANTLIQSDEIKIDDLM